MSEWSLPDPARRVRSVPEPIGAPPAASTQAATPVTTPPQPTAEPAPQSAALDRARTANGWMLAVGGGLAVLGSILPWSVVTTSQRVLSADGLRGDGRVTLLLGIVVVAVGVRALLAPIARPLVVAGLVAAAVSTVIAGFNAFDLQGFGTGSDQLASLNVGHGLLITAIGGVVAVVGGVRLVATAHDAPRTP